MNFSTEKKQTFCLTRFFPSRVLGERGGWGWETGGERPLAATAAGTTPLGGNGPEPAQGVALLHSNSHTGAVVETNFFPPPSPQQPRKPLTKFLTQCLRFLRSTLPPRAVLTGCVYLCVPVQDC